MIYITNIIGEYVTNQPSVSDWVVQVPLWPSGLGVGLWNRRPGIDTRTVRYTGCSGNPGSPLSGSSPPWLKVARARGLGFKKGGSNVTNQPSVSDWVVQVPLWPSGLGVGLWNRRPGIDTRTVRYTNLFVTTWLDNARTSTPGGYATTSDTQPCLWLNSVLWEFFLWDKDTVSSIQFDCENIPKSKTLSVPEISFSSSVKLACDALHLTENSQ